jgi:L-lactate utilization protein LutC|tara:strand:- start:526 stop:1143 length:618 start_codon:yes stop_codon:yes gene_type:complete
LKKLFRSFFKSKKSSTQEEESEIEYKYLPKKDELVEEKFTLNFISNGGKYLYAIDSDECEQYFNEILKENNWEEKSMLCFKKDFTKNFIPNNKIKFNKSNLNSNLFITDCEFLVAKDGSILVSAKQIQSYKSNDLPNNIIVMAKTSQLSETLSKGLEGIRIKYSNNLPSNITSIKNFNKNEGEDLNFLTYGSSAKNLYLILLEDL